MPRLRVLTYNIWMGGRGGPLLDQVVRVARPDVIVVNESPKAPCLWRFRVRRLTERWGMRYVVGGRDAGSNLIAVSPRVQVRSTFATTLPQPLLKPRRGIAAAQLRVEGRLFGVVACHLGLDPESRSVEVARVVEVAARLRGPVLVGGDLNEPPRGPSWRRLRQAGLVDHGDERWPTFPAADAAKRIDALLLGGTATVVHHGAPEVDEALLVRASDHRPVFAVLEI